MPQIPPQTLNGWSRGACHSIAIPSFKETVDCPDDEALSRDLRPVRGRPYAGERRELLLRSQKSEKHPTRLDVLVTDVRALEIRCWSDGLEMGRRREFERSIASRRGDRQANPRREARWHHRLALAVDARKPPRYSEIDD